MTRRLVLVVGLVVLLGGAVVYGWTRLIDDADPQAAAATTTAPEVSASTTVPPVTTTTVPPFRGWVDPASSGQPFPDATVEGLLTFRGNPTRSWYGEGPVPRQVRHQWSYPGSAMCSQSSEGSETRTWCGTGWTGQPAVFERDGRTWVVFGAYDRAVHFVDADTGQDIIPPFFTGDLIKGSVSIDPEGHPLVYVGSRDNYLRVIAFDRPEPTELWALSADAVSPTMWNNDWDGSPLIVGDHMLAGGENSQFHIVELNRSYGPGGLVQVAPRLVFNTPGWDDQLLAELGSSEVSIENSVALSGNTAYFANSGGLVQGWDLTGFRGGQAPQRTFRFWTGDDTDASVVVDAQGFLYVASEWERFNARAAEVGQIMKLDPRRPNHPVVWAVDDQGPGTAGVWATPALHRDLVIVATNGGAIKGIDRRTGEVRWEFSLPGPTWQSPVVVDDVLIQGDCNGVLHAYDVSDTTVLPPEIWSIELGGCIESTPAVWRGQIFVGTRAGLFHAVTGPAGPADPAPAGD
jgi:outer membrane protein assembly factor BamB